MQPPGTDGLIDDPRRCPFDPLIDLTACGEGETVQDECYSREEIRALATVYEDVVADGKQLAPSFPVGSEAYMDPSGVGDTFLPGWYLWRVGTEKPLFEAFAETFLRYMAFQRPDPDFDMFTFDFEEDPARIEWLRPILDATDPDLHRFRDLGGKMLMYFGWADPARIIGIRTGRMAREGADAIGRTRPLCPYPQVARYIGEGSIDDAANFERKAGSSFESP
ncbi:MAG: tannase/feruloyl esterase family alpha/beta hydrolase [Gemmatimonadota bacterium]